jgi:hypothetical protein
VPGWADLVRDRRRKKSPFNVAIAGDLVFRDANADLTDDQRAFQGVLAAFYQDEQENLIGFYGVYRRQEQESSALAGREFEESLNAWVIDSAGRFNAKIPGTRGFVFGEYEVVYLFGDTSLVRTVRPTAENEREEISSFGAAIGWVRSPLREAATTAGATSWRSSNGVGRAATRIRTTASRAGFVSIQTTTSA